MGPAGNTARQIFHPGVRDIEAGLASACGCNSARGRDRKRMMRRNKYTKGNLRARETPEAYGIEDGRMDGFGEEESQILEDRLRNKVTGEGGRRGRLGPACEDRKNRIARRKSSNEGGKRKEVAGKKKGNKSAQEKLRAA